MIGRLGVLLLRRRRVAQYLRTVRRNAWRWWWRSREHTNYTYHLHPLSRQHLVAALAVVLDRDEAEIEHYFAELENDQDLMSHYRTKVAEHSDGVFADRELRVGRRLAWYAVVRVKRPRLVVETGVDKGLGAIVLCAALARNLAEGDAGRYIGTDINPAAGWLLSGRYAQLGHVAYGDSLVSLAAIHEPIDLMINDSDHSADYEMAEYRCVRPQLADGAVIIGDNAHMTDCLQRFSREYGRRFLAHGEIPLDHWYPGAATGFSWVPQR